MARHPLAAPRIVSGRRELLYRLPARFGFERGESIDKNWQRIEATAGEIENEHHVWTKVSRKGAVRLGLRDSVAKYLTPENKLSTPHECFAAVLKGNETSAEALDAALRQMLQICAGKERGRYQTSWQRLLAEIL